LATSELTDSEIKQKISSFCHEARYAWKYPWYLLLVSILFVIVEFLFSPLERALGEFMLWSRPIRVEAGAGWEWSHEGAEADRKLGELAEEIEDRKIAGLSLTDWAEIPGLLERYKAFSISPKRFLGLYEKLPKLLQPEIILPLDILRIQASGKWQRVFFIEDKGDQHIFLVDSRNVVLAQRRMTRLFFDRWTGINNPITTTLNDLEEFMGRAFPANLFFDAVEPMGPVVLSSLDTDLLASLEGKLIRVGISIESEQGLSVLALEFSRPDGNYLYKFWIEKKEARELFREMMDQYLLEGEL